MSRKQGDGAAPTALKSVVKAAADKLFQTTDACVVIAYRQSGTGDNEEQVVMVRRGASVMLNGVMDALAQHGFGGDVSVETEDDDEETAE